MMKKPDGILSPDDDFYRLMRFRRSVREYTAEDVVWSKVERILAAGLLAPSGADRRPFAFIVVDDPDLKARIREVCEAADAEWHRRAPDWLKEWLDEKGIRPVKPFLTDVPYLIVVAGEGGYPYWLESTWIAISYMILAAAHEGLATLTYTPGNTRALKGLLDLPDHFQPVTILPVGWPADPAPKVGSPVAWDEKVFYNRYNRAAGEPDAAPNINSE